MAKKTTINEDLFKKTTPQKPAEKTETLKGTNISVYLSGENRADFEKIADETGLTVHNLLQTAARQFLVRYAAGEIHTREETVTKIIIE